MTVIEIISAIMIGFGALFFLGGAVGLLRFPDFYTRMHAAGKGDTLSTLLMLGGLALYHAQDFSLATALVSLKILGIIFFILITSPTSSHALMQAGYELGLKPWRKYRKRK